MTTVRRVASMSNGGVYRYVPRTGLWSRLSAREIRDGYEAYRRLERDARTQAAYRRSLRRRIEFDRPAVRRNLFVMSRRVYDTAQHRFRVASPDMYLLCSTGWSYSADQADRYGPTLDRRLHGWFPDDETRRWVMGWFGQLLHGRRAPEHQFVLWLMTDDERLSRLLIRTFDRYARDDVPPPSRTERALLHKRLLLVDHASHGRKMHERNLRRFLNCEDPRIECGLCVVSSLPPIEHGRRPYIVDPDVRRRITACLVNRAPTGEENEETERMLVHPFFRRLTEACRDVPPPTLNAVPRRMLADANLVLV